jgi:hypothetical protein
MYDLAPKTALELVPADPQRPVPAALLQSWRRRHPTWVPRCCRTGSVRGGAWAELRVGLGLPRRLGVALSLAASAHARLGPR